MSADYDARPVDELAARRARRRSTRADGEARPDEWARSGAPDSGRPVSRGPVATGRARVPSPARAESVYRHDTLRDEAYRDDPYSAGLRPDDLHRDALPRDASDEQSGADPARARVRADVARDEFIRGLTQDDLPRDPGRDYRDRNGSRNTFARDIGARDHVNRDHGARDHPGWDDAARDFDRDGGRWDGLGPGGTGRFVERATGWSRPAEPRGRRAAGGEGASDRDHGRTGRAGGYGVAPENGDWDTPSRRRWRDAGRRFDEVAHDEAGYDEAGYDGGRYRLGARGISEVRTDGGGGESWYDERYDSESFDYAIGDEPVGEPLDGDLGAIAWIDGRYDPPRPVPPRGPAPGTVRSWSDVGSGRDDGDSYPGGRYDTGRGADDDLLYRPRRGPDHRDDDRRAGGRFGEAGTGDRYAARDRAPRNEDSHEDWDEDWDGGGPYRPQGRRGGERPEPDDRPEPWRSGAAVRPAAVPASGFGATAGPPSSRPTRASSSSVPPVARPVASRTREATPVVPRVVGRTSSQQPRVVATERPAPVARVVSSTPQTPEVRPTGTAEEPVAPRVKSTHTPLAASRVVGTAEDAPVRPRIAPPVMLADGAGRTTADGTRPDGTGDADAAVNRIQVPAQRPTGETRPGETLSDPGGAGGSGGAAEPGAADVRTGGGPQRPPVEAAWDQAAREQAQRDEEARRRVIREQEEREQAARDAAARAIAEATAREQAARERAAREQAEREQAAREKAAWEQAEREQAAREQAERERLAREKAAREAVPRAERIVADVRWRLDTDTLREVVDDQETLRGVVARLEESFKAVTDDSARARLLSLRSEVLRLLGEQDGAAADSRLALAHGHAARDDLAVALARTELGQVLRLRGEFVEADRLFLEVVVADVPDGVRSVAHENAGRCCVDQGRYLEACDHFGQAMRLGDPEDLDLVARLELTLDAIYIKVLRDGWGPAPRWRTEIMSAGRAPVVVPD